MIKGFANMSGNRYNVIGGVWQRYNDDILNGRSITSGIWVVAQTLNHEVGHNLSLNHTMRTPGGTCTDNAEDYCADTPTRGYIISNFGFDPCCGWGGNTDCTNNLMDYDGEDAVTPEQLGRIHWTIENDLIQYKTCYFNYSLSCYKKKAKDKIIKMETIGCRQK